MPKTVKPVGTSYRCRQDGTRMASTLNCAVLKSHAEFTARFSLTPKVLCQDCPGPEIGYTCLGCKVEVFTDGEKPLDWVEHDKGYLCSNCQRARFDKPPTIPANPAPPTTGKSRQDNHPPNGRPWPGSRG